jgi:SAM-dependent methyltransferase
MLTDYIYIKIHVKELNQMNREYFINKLSTIFDKEIQLDGNFVVFSRSSQLANQQQTNEAFTEKWHRYEQSEEKLRLFNFQKNWYLNLYGFSSEEDFQVFLRTKYVIFDAGCGLGYKAAWFAHLAPHSLVIGMDFSDSALQAAQEYRDLPNLFFIQGDIANTGLVTGCVDYANCDQVIMHTESPEATFTELTRITSVKGGELACYFYAKKALPRELLDDYFRVHCTHMNRSDLWAMCEQLTELGKRLSELKVSFNCPEIPALGIKAGTIDVQRFVYWNFIKCFWNGALGVETSVVTNFDWYSPSNARRFSEEEVRTLALNNRMTESFFHIEEAAYSGRFIHA